MGTKPEKLPSLAEKIDRLGQLEAELAPWKAKIKQATDLRSEIRAAFEASEQDVEASGQLRGTAYFSLTGPRNFQTRIRSMRAVFKAVGQAKFLERCAYTLERLAEDAPDQYSSLVVTERTGPRDVKTFALPKVA
jgi:ribosomal protein L19E